MLINGFELPQSILHGLEVGYWIKRSSCYESVSKEWAGIDIKTFEAFFPLVAKIDPQLYPIEIMISETKAMVNLDPRDQQFYYGAPNKRYPPGDIDPQFLVSIGDLGGENFLELDYREDPKPRLIYLTSLEPDPIWATATGTIDDLMGILADAHRKSGQA